MIKEGISVKKAFETPAIEVFRMQVSEELTVSSTEPIGEAIGTFGLRGIASVEDWFTK